MLTDRTNNSLLGSKHKVVKGSGLHNLGFRTWRITFQGFAPRALREYPLVTLIEAAQGFAATSAAVLAAEIALGLRSWKCWVSSNTHDSADS